MVVLGFDEPPWVTILKERGPELALAVMGEVDGVRMLSIEPDVEAACVVAGAESTHRDRYSTAFRVTQALTELWSGFADETVALRVCVGSLQVDVPSSYFAEGICTRRRWATLSRSMLVHGSVHDDVPPGLFDDQHRFDD